MAQENEDLESSRLSFMAIMSSSRVCKCKGTHVASCAVCKRLKEVYAAELAMQKKKLKGLGGRGSVLGSCSSFLDF